MVDTHCHIFSSDYNNIDDVIKRAIDNGVRMIIVNGCDAKTNNEVLELVKKYDIVYGALGIHPEEVDNYKDEDIDFIIKHIDDDKIVAVGEIGLDYHYDYDKKKQIMLFKRQLEIAKSFNKPVIIHSRDSIQDTYNILKEYNVKGIMHCFSGSLEMASEFIKLGFLLGIGGIVTFKNSKKILDVLKEISIEYIVLETDSPYLAPEPNRGKQNEPAYIGLIAKKIADIKGITYEEVNSITTSNVSRLFDKQLMI
ncbi:MAG: TatD family hydrolase [Bacilli bacterium]|nr:TatD family hydrolase [Bacilli bacterium]